jgi:hypothetical protein
MRLTCCRTTRCCQYVKLAEHNIPVRHPPVSARSISHSHLHCRTCSAAADVVQSAESAVGPICEDPRQFVPASGQAWTNLAELGPSRTVSIVRDDEDVRISSINVDPPVGINQTRGSHHGQEVNLRALIPLYSVHHRDGGWIVYLGLRRDDQPGSGGVPPRSETAPQGDRDFSSSCGFSHFNPDARCCITDSLLPAACFLVPAYAARYSLLVAWPMFAADEPQFFASSLTWARALRVPLYLCKADKRWFQRLGDIRPEDNVQWWSGEAILGQGVKVVQCGG